MIIRIIEYFVNIESVRRKDALAIKAAFDDFKRDRYGWNTNGIPNKSPSGEVLFYEAKAVDAAIDRVNAVLTKMTK